MESDTLSWSSEKTFEKLRELLRAGQVIAGSGDTVPGLLASITSNGFAKLNHIKQRAGKPYLILISDISKLDYFVRTPLSDHVNDLLSHTWPGPLTVVLPVRDDAPLWLAPNKTIAVRVPAHAGLQKLLTDFPGLFSTSANIAGQSVPESVAQIAPAIRSAVAALVDDQPTIKPSVFKPSTIIDATQEPPVILRKGAYPVDELVRRYGVRLGV